MPQLLPTRPYPGDFTLSLARPLPSPAPPPAFTLMANSHLHKLTVARLNVARFDGNRTFHLVLRVCHHVSSARLPFVSVEYFMNLPFMGSAPSALATHFVG